MARLPRYVIPGQPQHIIQRGNNRQVIFRAEADYQFFRNALTEAAEKHQLAIHAYVWMTNHIHLLATPGVEGSISKVFQSVGTRYVKYFNRCHQRSGTLWEGRYRATVVDAEGYFLTLMRYIELNPVRAGMVAHPGDYRWSSYAFNAHGKSGIDLDWLVPHELYSRLGECEGRRQKAYRELFRTPLSDDALQAIREMTHKGWALGGEAFQEGVEASTNRRAVSKGVGRPKNRNGV